MEIMVWGKTICAYYTVCAPLWDLSTAQNLQTCSDLGADRVMSNNPDCRKMSCIVFRRARVCVRPTVYVDQEIPVTDSVSLCNNVWLKLSVLSFESPVTWFGTATPRLSLPAGASVFPSWDRAKSLELIPAVRLSNPIPLLWNPTVSVAEFPEGERDRHAVFAQFLSCSQTIVSVSGLSCLRDSSPPQTHSFSFNWDRL